MYAAFARCTRLSFIDGESLRDLSLRSSTPLRRTVFYRGVTYSGQTTERKREGQKEKDKEKAREKR